MKFFTLFFAILCFAFPSQAMDGLKIGVQIPTNLELKDESNNLQSFDHLSGDKGLVLFFIRSADWCPYCQVQLLDLRKGAAKGITNAGYNIAILSYDTPEKLSKFATKYKFDFPMLSDEGSKTINAFGILDETKEEGTFAYGIPHPTIYIISKDQKIQGILSKESYTRRPEIQDIENAIQKIQAQN